MKKTNAKTKNEDKQKKVTMIQKTVDPQLPPPRQIINPNNQING